MSDGRRRDAPDEMTPREAVQRWLKRKRGDCRDQTVGTYWYRLKLFVGWTEREDYDWISDLTAWDIDEYQLARRAEGIEPVSLDNELKTLEAWLSWCATVDLVNDGLAEVIERPTLDDEDVSSDVMLEPERGETLLGWYRDGPEHGTRAHALLEVEWTVGARVGAIRSLDVRDFDHGRRTLDFEHRPDTDTELKKGRNGERPVGILPAAADAIQSYLEEYRLDKRDDHGRTPLFTSAQGRPTTGTLRDWTYLATVPCLHGPCPHGKERPTCEWTSYDRASNCPSSRSPHRVRTGSITWQLSRGVPVEVVAKRVNSSVETIRKHYDKEDPFRELEERRRPHLENLEIESEPNHDD